MNENGFLAVFEAEDGIEAVAIAENLQPDLVLLDIAMPKLNGIKAAARIRVVAPQSRILFVSQNTDPDVLQSVLSDAISNGYVWKSAISRDLQTAIETIFTGGRFVSSGLRLHRGGSWVSSDVLS